MSERTADSLKNLCRTCMTSFANMKRDTRTTIHRQSISEKPAGCDDGPSIMELLQIVQPFIEVQLQDDLPKLICVGCVQQLQLAHEFLEMYRDSDDKFRKLLKEVYLQEEAISPKELDENFEEMIDKVEDTEVISAGDTKITKFEIEIESLGETISMQRDALDIDDEFDEAANDWLEFIDEPEPISNRCEDDDEKDMDKTEIFDNPYSDTSDNEWTPNEDTRYLLKIVTFTWEHILKVFYKLGF